MNKKQFIAFCKLLGCGIPTFWAGVISFAYPGVMSLFWQEEFKVGNTETGLVITFMLLALAITMFISGRVHAKIGMPKCILIGTFFYFLAFIFLIFANNIYMVYLWAFTSNLGCSFTFGPGLTTVQCEFPTRKGMVSGILNLSFGIASAIMSPILNALLNGKGYLFVNLFTISMIIICNLFAFLLVKFSLNNKNYKKPNIDSSKDMTVSQALKSKEFWLIWFLWIFMGASGISMITLSKSYSIAIGEQGITILTTFNLANGLIRIFVGWLTDKIGPRITGAIAFLVTTISYFIMPHSSNVLLVSLCAAGVGIGFGTLFTISGPLAADIFGLTNFGTIYGIIFTAYGLISGIVGPAISGMILEKTNNNYFIVFTYLGIMAFFGTILIYCIKEKKPKNGIKKYKKYSDSNSNSNSNTNINSSSNSNSDSNLNSSENINSLNSNPNHEINEKESVTVEIECENKSKSTSPSLSS